MSLSKTQAEPNSICKMQAEFMSSPQGGRFVDGERPEQQGAVSRAGKCTCRIGRVSTLVSKHFEVDWIRRICFIIMIAVMALGSVQADPRFINIDN